MDPLSQETLIQFLASNSELLTEAQKLRDSWAIGNDNPQVNALFPKGNRDALEFTSFDNNNIDAYAQALGQYDRELLSNWTSTPAITHISSDTLASTSAPGESVSSPASAVRELTQFPAPLLSQPLNGQEFKIPLPRQPGAFVEKRPDRSAVTRYTNSTIQPELSWTRAEVLPYEPNGDLRIKVKMSIAESNPRWNITAYCWAYTSARNSKKLQGYLERRYCLGIFACTNKGECYNSQRVPTSSRITREIAAPLCERCAAPMVHVRCPVVWDTLRPMTGQDFLIYFHHYHTHAPPPNGKLNTSQYKKMKTIVQSMPGSTPQELKFFLGYDSQGKPTSVLDINRSLANNSRIKYIKDKVGKELQLSSAATKGSEVFFNEWDQIQRELPGWIKHYSFDAGSRIIVMQSDSMKSFLNSFEVRTNNQSGYVSDAAHGFFRNGLLMITCVFSDNLLRWAPTVFSFMASNTAECYSKHFIVLFRSILEVMTRTGTKCTDEHYANVADYSAAQREGFKLAFVQHMEETELPSLNHSSTLEELRLSWKQRASACYSGCSYHYDKAVTRAKSISKMIPFDFQSQFQTLAMSLKHCALDEFDVTVRTIRKNFPAAGPWLDFWISSANASMIFDCKRTMSNELLDRLPETSNAVESLHARIYLSCGILRGSNKLFGVLDGIRALARHAEIVAKETDAASTGISLSYGTQQRSRISIAKTGSSRPHKGFEKNVHENDGRPPDTNAKLDKLQKKGNKIVELNLHEMVDGIRFMDKSISNGYQSTVWDNNSCYLDVLIEVLYFIYIRNQQYWDQALSRAEGAGALITFFKCLQARQMAYQTATTATSLSDHLAGIRNEIRLRLVEDNIIQLGAFDSAASVYVTMVSAAPDVFQRSMTQELLKYDQCIDGHISAVQKVVATTIALQLLPASFPGETKSILEQVCVKLLPEARRSSDVYIQRHCSIRGCMEYTEKMILPTSLPEILVIEEQDPDLMNNVESWSVLGYIRYEFPGQITVAARKHQKLSYTLIARLEYNENHYTGLFMAQARNQIYHYDGLSNNGRAQALTGSRKDVLKQFTGVRSTVTTAWYILDSATESQSEYVKHLRISLEKSGAVLEYSCKTSQWTLHRQDYTSFKNRASSKTDSVATDTETSEETSGELYKACSEAHNNLPETDSTQQPIVSSLNWLSDNSDLQSDSPADPDVEIEYVEDDLLVRTPSAATSARGLSIASDDSGGQSGSITPASAIEDHKLYRKHAQALGPSEDTSLQSKKRHLGKQRLMLKRVRPSYDYVLVPRDLPAPKEFVECTNIPRRSRTCKKTVRRN